VKTDLRGHTDMSSTAMLMDEEIKVTPVTNAVTWFEIPTYKLERARMQIRAM
jgi:hypothetical protein